VAHWIGAAASRRGTAHARRGEARQDAVALRFPGKALVAVVADGAGSAPRGGAGAALACRTLAAAASSLADRRGTAALLPCDLAALMEGTHAALAEAAARAGIAVRDLATTALLVVSDGARTLSAHVGDGAAVARTAEGWRILSWPETGAHAGTTRFLTEAPPAVRTACIDVPVTAVALLTDGLERLVLDLARCTPHPPFFDMIAEPLDRLADDPATPSGRDRPLSAALARYLDGERVNERTDDDRTLAVAVRRAAPAS